MKYWFSDLKKKNIDFLDELGLFIGEKPIFTKKKFPSLCRLPWFHGCTYENLVRPIFERCFQVRDFSFRITEGVGPTGVCFNFRPQKQIPSGSCHTNFWLLFHFHVKNLPNFMFLGLIWCKILRCAQKSILYGVWNATGSHESPKTEFVTNEIFISRVTYPSIRNAELKKVYFKRSKVQSKATRAQKRNWIVMKFLSWEPNNLNKF
jgi:hypothetical protein